MNSAAINYYFRSKEGLFRTVMERIGRKHAAFLDDFSNTNPVEALTRATQRFVRILADNPNYVRLCAYCALEGTKVHEEDEMMRNLMDEVVFEPFDEGTRVRLVKYRTPTSQTPQAPVIDVSKD